MLIKVFKDRILCKTIHNKVEVKVFYKLSTLHKDWHWSTYDSVDCSKLLWSYLALIQSFALSSMLRTGLKVTTPNFTS